MTIAYKQKEFAFKGQTLFVCQLMIPLLFTQFNNRDYHFFQ